MRTNRRFQRGVISIETALLLPAVLAVLMVFFDITRVHLQYSLLEHAMRHSLRVLIAEDWRKQPLNIGVVQGMIEANSYGFIDAVDVDITRYNSLNELLSVEEEEQVDNRVFRPADPVFRVSATLKTQLQFSPLAAFYSQPLVFRSTVIVSQDLLFD